MLFFPSFRRIDFRKKSQKATHRLNRSIINAYRERFLKSPTILHLHPPFFWHLSSPAPFFFPTSTVAGRLGIKFLLWSYRRLRCCMIYCAPSQRSLIVRLWDLNITILFSVDEMGTLSARRTEVNGPPGSPTSSTRVPVVQVPPTRQHVSDRMHFAGSDRGIISFPFWGEGRDCWGAFFIVSRFKNNNNNLMLQSAVICDLHLLAKPQPCHHTCSGSRNALECKEPRQPFDVYFPVGLLRHT